MEYRLRFMGVFMSKKTNRIFLSFALFLLGTALFFYVMQKPLLSPLATAASAEDAFTVVIDAGHGGIDAGAIGVNGSIEKDLNLVFAETLAALFEENGVRVLLTRKSDTLVLKDGEENAPSRKACDLKNRVALANSVENALLISIHMNSFPEEKYRGFEVYYSENHPDSRLYAEGIQSAVKEKHEPYSKRRAKASDSIYLLAHSQNPAILIECGFLSNREDAAKLSDKDYQKELSFSVFCAIMEVKEHQTERIT